MPARRWPRRKSHNIPGHAHELTFSTYRGFRFLASDMVCEWLAESIGAARIKHEFRLWSGVFMPDHVHVSIYPELGEYRISDILAGASRTQPQPPFGAMRRRHGWLAPTGGWG